MFFRDFEPFEEMVVQCFDEDMGSFENLDRNSFGRKKREYLSKFNTLAQTAHGADHVIRMVLTSHELFLEKIQVNVVDLI